MAEPELAPKGQPETPAVPSAPTEAPAEVTAPVGAQPATPSPPTGKTVEELAAMVEESKRFITESREELSRIRHERDYFKTLADQTQEGKRTAPEAEEVPPIAGDEFLVDPGKAMAKLGTWIRDGVRKDLARKDAEQYVNTVRQNFEEGKAAALKENPRLLSGVESAVESQMFEAVRQGAIKDPTALRDPKMWAIAALAEKVKRGEFDLAKMFTTAPTPMTAGHSETPTPVVPKGESVVLSDSDRSRAREWGISDEQMMEQIKRDRAELDRQSR